LHSLRNFVGAARSRFFPKRLPFATDCRMLICVVALLVVRVDPQTLLGTA
jgi:hypothetical protein